MAEKILLQSILFGVALSDWIEISKVGNTNTGEVGALKESSNTPPSYEITLGKPHLYELTTEDTESQKTVYPQVPVSFLDKDFHSNSKNLKIPERVIRTHQVNKAKSTHDNKNRAALENILINKINATNSDTHPDHGAVGPNEDNHNTTDNNTTVDNQTPAEESEISIEDVAEDSIESKEMDETLKRSNVLLHNKKLVKSEPDISVEDVDYYDEEDDDEEYVEEQDDAEMDKEEDPTNQSSGIMSLIKHVQNQLLDFKGGSLIAKIEHLKKLRDNILYEIKYRIFHLFKTPKRSKDDSRLYKDVYSDEHHLDYPSNEGALMTIGFLTFAVFLIKLVLKLIYELKLKQQYYYYQSTTTTPASIFLKRNEREINREQQDESARILRYLEEYSAT